MVVFIYHYIYYYNKCIGFEHLWKVWKLVLVKLISHLLQWQDPKALLRGTFALCINRIPREGNGTNHIAGRSFHIVVRSLITKNIIYVELVQELNPTVELSCLGTHKFQKAHHCVSPIILLEIKVVLMLMGVYNTSVLSYEYVVKLLSLAPWRCGRNDMLNYWDCAFQLSKMWSLGIIKENMCSSFLNIHILRMWILEMPYVFSHFVVLDNLFELYWS